MKVTYGRRALDQIDDIFTFIARENPAAAIGFFRRVETLISLAARRPEIGRLTNLDNVLSVRTYPYLIFIAF